MLQKIQNDTLKTIPVRLKKRCFFERPRFLFRSVDGNRFGKNSGLNVDVKIFDSEESRSCHLMSST